MDFIRRKQLGESAPSHAPLFAHMIGVNGGPVAAAKNLGVNQDHLADHPEWTSSRLRPRVVQSQTGSG